MCGDGLMILDTLVPLGKRYVLVGLTQCNVPIPLSELHKQMQCWSIMESGEKESLLKFNQSISSKDQYHVHICNGNSLGDHLEISLYPHTLHGKVVTGTKEIQFLMSLSGTD